jgi:hypothetical protein
LRAPDSGEMLTAPPGRLHSRPQTSEHMRTYYTDFGRRLAIAPSALRRTLSTLLAFSPLLFGVPVVMGIAISIGHLLSTGHPVLFWEATVNDDAEQLYLGHTLYNDPAHGYVGLFYTPLYPALISLVDHIHLWSGWSVLLTFGASTSLLGLAAGLAYNPTGPTRRSVQLLAALGIGGLAYWCVSGMELSLLANGRGDQLAWAFALFGLIAVADFGRSPPRRHVVLAALLLSAAFWTKQTTIGVAILAVAWVLVLAFLSVLRGRSAWLFVAVLVGVNLALLLAQNVLTEGREFYVTFELPLAMWSSSNYGPLIVNGAETCELMVPFIAATWLASIVAAARDRHRRANAATLRRLLAGSDPTGRRILLLSLYVIFGFVLAVYFRRAQGTGGNHFIGVVWTLGLLAAIGWRVAQRNYGTATTAGIGVALFFGLSQIGPARSVLVSTGLGIPALEQVDSWHELSPTLLAAARNHTIYLPELSDLNVPEGGPLYTDFYHIADLLAAGRQPTYLVQALLNRRIEYVGFFGLENLFTSSHGKWEEHYLWKLDEVIAARYQESSNLPGLLERRAGPEHDVWMRRCFGPFAAAGVSFRIGHGGGFWCSFAADQLGLVRAPTPLSEVLTTQPVHASGTVTVTIAKSAFSQADLVLEHGRTPFWTARVTPSPTDSHDVVIETSLDGAPLGSTSVPAMRRSGGKRSLLLDLTINNGHIGIPVRSGTGAATLTAPAMQATFALIATEGASVDLSRAHLAS